MEIAITLPKHLWNKICSGEKKFECRKRIPRDFMCCCNKVWVVQKGTASVVGWFTVDEFLTFIDVEEIRDSYLDKICVDREWFDAYAKNEDTLCLWRIGHNVHKLSEPRDRDRFLDIHNNPQFFAYCRGRLVC